MKSILTLVTVLLISTAIHAQNRVVNGKLTAYNTFPVMNVEVSSKKAKATTMTDSLGIFSIVCLEKDVIMIKPKGYNVFPTEVENFLSNALKDKVESVGVVGYEHEIFSEGIIAFAEKKKGITLNPEEVYEASKEMASYKRPSHVVILEFNEMPLNRVNKTDYVALQQYAENEVKKLRDAGSWDRASGK